MAGPKPMFSKLRLTPGQWRAVAERRFADAYCLYDSGQQDRANGTIYMAGFVIECLLKAILLERHPNLQNPVDPASLSKHDREVHSLLYSHELVDMLEFIPEVKTKLMNISTTEGNAWRNFDGICAQWTIHARYSPKNVKRDQAKSFLDTLEEAKKWLKEL